MTNNTAASTASDNAAVVDDNDDINSIRTRRATKILDGLVDHPPKIPGIQYMIVTAESILFDYSGGIRDAATLKEVTKNTTFLSSSTTKVLTATAILKLVEQGKIGSLDDPLSKYYKEHPYDNNNNEDTSIIQIRHLLNQSSGIPNPLPLAWLHTCEDHHQNGGYKENDALAVALKDNSQLDFPPGEKYQYSNLSYWLLGKVIEQSSGMSYRQYMKKEIFDPLNIQEAELDTEINHNDSDSSDSEYYYARGHLPRYSIFTLIFWFLVPNWLWDTSSGYWARLRVLYMNGPAYGGMIASASGYAKFLQDILKIIKTQQQQQQQHSIKTDDIDINSSSSSSSVLFSKEGIQNLIFKEQYDTSNRLLPTTLGGWHRGKLKNNNKNKHDDNISYDYFSKPGGGPGYSSNIRIYPTLGIASIYLCNKAEASETPINSLSDLIDIEFLSSSPPIAAS